MIKKKIINGKIVYGVVDQNLQETIPFSLGYENIEWKKDIFICEKDGVKHAYNPYCEEIFTEEDNCNYVENLFDNYFVVERDGKLAIVYKNYHASIEAREKYPDIYKMEIAVNFGKFDEYKKTDHKVEKIISHVSYGMVSSDTYELIKHDEDGNVIKGWFNHPIYGTISPRFSSMEELQANFYHPDDSNFLIDVGFIASKKVKGKDKFGFYVIDKNPEKRTARLVKGLPHEYTSIYREYGPYPLYYLNLKRQRRNGEKKGRIIYKRCDKPGELYLEKVGEIECEYDKLFSLYKNNHYTKAVKDGKAGIFYDNDLVIECEYDDIDLMCDKIFVGKKNEEGSRIITFSPNTKEKAKVYGNEDWENVEILKNYYSRNDSNGFVAYLDINYWHFCALVTLNKDGITSKKLVNFYRDRNDEYIIRESEEYKNISEFGPNKYLATRHDGTSDIINQYGEIIIHDFNVEKSGDGDSKIYIYDNNTKQKVLTDDAASNVIVDEIPAKYRIKPTYINGMWKREYNGEIDFIPSSETQEKDDIHNEVIKKFLSQKFNFFEVYDAYMNSTLIHAKVVNSDGKEEDVLFRDFDPILKGEFNVEARNNNFSRLVISVNDESQEKKFGVINGQDGNIVIPFDYQNITLNGNEFIATLNGEEIVFDSDGFLTDESIKKEINREKQFKKKI